MILTFAVVRTWLHLSTGSNFNLAGYNIHHLFTGILLMVPAGLALILVPAARERFRFPSIIFGIGLVLDEWVYLLVTDGSDMSYLLPESFIGGFVMVGLAALAIVLIDRRLKRK